MFGCQISHNGFGIFPFLERQGLLADFPLFQEIPKDLTSDIRIVEIVGYDVEACGGTHLATTGEIGRLRIKKVENKGKNNKRMDVVLE